MNRIQNNALILACLIIAALFLMLKSTIEKITLLENTLQEQQEIYTENEKKYKDAIKTISVLQKTKAQQDIKVNELLNKLKNAEKIIGTQQADIKAYELNINNMIQTMYKCVQEISLSEQGLPSCALLFSEDVQVIQLNR